MARDRIRYFREKPGRGGPRFFWEPSAELLAAGWKHVALKDREGRHLGRAQAQARAIELNAELDAARLAGASTGSARGAQPSRTLEALIEAYRRSDDFARLRPKTQDGYEYALRLLEDWSRLTGGAPLAEIDKVAVGELYRSFREATPAKAAALVRTLQAAWSWGCRNAAPDGRAWCCEPNPAAKQKLSQGRQREPEIWEPADVQVFVAVADLVGFASVGTAVMLDEWIGQRQGDLLRLPVDAYRTPRGQLFEQSKRRARVKLPLQLLPQAIKDRLDAELARRERAGLEATTLLVDERTGQPWNQDGFNKAFAQVRRGAACLRPSLAGLWFMWLRHTAITRLFESGCSVGQIADVTGHSLKGVLGVIERYLKRTGKLAEQAFQARLAHERRQLELDEAAKGGEA